MKKFMLFKQTLQVLIHELPNKSEKFQAGEEMHVSYTFDEHTDATDFIVKMANRVVGVDDRLLLNDLANYKPSRIRGLKNTSGRALATCPQMPCGLEYAVPGKTRSRWPHTTTTSRCTISTKFRHFQQYSNYKV